VGIEVDHISKSFRQDRNKALHKAVDDISFSCQPGEIFGLLGPNGAGKTTTLRILSTILTPDHGTAIINGHDVIKEPEKVRRSLGYMSTETALYPRLTPREIMECVANLCDYPSTLLTKRVADVIQWLGMENFADTQCSKLSSGMKQRASIARAIVHDPPVLILDEPTSTLDVLAANSMHKFVLECKAQGKTVIFSTHIMSEAEKLCDRIGIIHAGKLVANGTVDDLKTQTQKEDIEEVFLALAGDMA
jgi:sodium transport system ATP-binding protein